MSVFQDEFNFSDKKIIISPLNWGLGHASRLIPIIHHLQKKNEIILVGENPSIKLLSKTFPDLKSEVWKGKQIRYAKRKFFKTLLFLQLPYLVFMAFREHSKLKGLIEKYKADIVISDNRYGFFNNTVTSLFITHQISPFVSKQFRFIDRWVNRIIVRRINHFDKCIVPDFSGNDSLCRNLLYRFQIPNKLAFIGPVSQLSDCNSDENIVYKYLAIFSGPEPQRSIFERIIVQKMRSLKDTCMIIKGRFDLDENERHANIHTIAYASGKEIENYIRKSEIIICRSGYSSIMDMLLCNKPVILVPTPGQTEQEYLGECLNGKYNFTTYHQNKIDLD